MKLVNLKTHEEIAQAFDAFLELRPFLRDAKTFTDQVVQQQKEGYEIIALSQTSPHIQNFVDFIGTEAPFAIFSDFPTKLCGSWQSGHIS